jgi:hypothetical protein
MSWPTIVRARLSSILRQVRGRGIGRHAARHALVGRPELWEMKRRFQFEFLKAHGLQPHHRLVDIGCGTLRGGLPLIALLDSGNFFGIEARRVALRAALREIREADLEHKRPTLIHSRDFVVEGLDRRIHYAWAFSVLIHFDDHVLRKCLGAVSRWLMPNGIFFANANIGHRSTRRWEEFPVVSRPLDFYREQGGNFGLRLEDLGELRQLGHVSGIADQDQQRMLAFHRY